MEKLTIKGESHGVILPGFAEREELALAYQGQLKLQKEDDGVRIQFFRLFSAALGIMVPRLGRRLAEKGISYEKCGADPIVFGGKAYNYFREQGYSTEEISSSGIALFGFLSENLSPKEQEVKEKANFIDQNGAS
jgi:hypothetical protein